MGTRNWSKNLWKIQTILYKNLNRYLVKKKCKKVQEIFNAAKLLEQKHCASKSSMGNSKWSKASENRLDWLVEWMRVLTPGCIWNKLAMNNFIYYLYTEIRGLWRWYRCAFISNLRLSVSCIIMNTPPPPSSPLLHKHTSKIQNICGFCFFTSEFFMERSVQLLATKQN